MSPCLYGRLVSLGIGDADSQHGRLEFLLCLENALDLTFKFEKIILSHYNLFDL